ncbi:hypothetical protein PR003_g23745 [Phytophthora rubi]|uniref:Uncharacterized protein n=1 Tax=Phytophthora rubi TaxID=129364 RepID=A0A6A3JWR6_9STRA|nr:hypothetical protein PR002_g18375 [Phytophthora rubi]KAE9001287.1 hypothetical protein PR001_g18566 [Phytophthora rubi]KAE9296488.1 hypothetical protein PR003_g23745 [Phytophthora rubi]
MSLICFTQTGPSALKREANRKVMVDHIVMNAGTINYCVRWYSTEKLSKSTTSKFQAMLER